MVNPRPTLMAALAALPLLLSCTTPAAAPAEAASPPWVTALIAKLQSQPLSNPPASIVRYDYAGRSVYYLPPKCCDFPSTLLDVDGNRLCSPDGGITGRGDRQCEDFHSSRSDEQLIWKDERVRERRR